MQFKLVNYIIVSLKFQLFLSEIIHVIVDTIIVNTVGGRYYDTTDSGKIQNVGC